MRNDSEQSFTQLNQTNSKLLNFLQCESAPLEIKIKLVNFFYVLYTICHDFMDFESSYENIQNFSSISWLLCRPPPQKHRDMGCD